jgi:hypothetical protein
MTGSSIAAEVRAAFVEVHEQVGTGAVVYSTLRRPGDALSDSGGNPGPENPWEVAGSGDAADDVATPDPVDFDVLLYRSEVKERDENKRLTGRIITQLTIPATETAPRKGDLIAVFVPSSEVDAATEFATIKTVERKDYAGEPISYLITLED